MIRYALLGSAVTLLLVGAATLAMVLLIELARWLVRLPEPWGFLIWMGAGLAGLGALLGVMFYHSERRGQP